VLYLNDDTLNEPGSLLEAGIAIPAFDREKVAEQTYRHPVWIHFGAGNLFRCFHAALQQKLLNANAADEGIVVVETYDDEVIETVFRSTNNLSLAVVMKANGEIEKELIASVTESHFYPDPASTVRVREIFANPSLQMATVTITEKGYNLKNPDGTLSAVVRHDIEQGPAQARHAMSVMAALLFERYENGAHPIAMVSTDNFSRNGTKLGDAIREVATQWKTNNFVDQGFIDYLADPKSVSFPWSMIDRITPGPSVDVAEKLRVSGFGDIDILKSQKHSITAPFVNTEEVHYLVIEDDFPNGRPALEDAGVYFTDRDTVNKVERMKVCTCLNPLHTAMAVFGCLLGYESIAEETQDPEISGLIRQIGYIEGLPVVTDPGIIDPKSFLDEVMNKRLPNPRIPDTPQRIASDTSQKVGIRFGETIKLYQESGQAGDLQFIPLAIAGWCRYLLGVDDQGEEFELSPDPMDEFLHEYVAEIVFGDATTVAGHLRPILSNTDIFGVDLYEANLGQKIEGFVEEMVAGPNAVRSTLQKYLKLSGEDTSCK